MKYDLTILVPGIRVRYWHNIYSSIEYGFSGTWEMIFISPYELPPYLNKPNVKWIQDWGSPIRCQQRGLCEAQGKWITWGADDGYFLLMGLDIGFYILKEHNMDYKTVVMGKYIEGNKYIEHMKGNYYYDLNLHQASQAKHIPKPCYMLNVGLISRKLLNEFGGWDCRFEACPMAYNDLAVRLQLSGIKFVLQNELMFSCSHTPDKAGDHMSVNDAQIENDIPLFKKKYNDGGSPFRIDINNWKDAPERWERRFGT